MGVRLEARAVGKGGLEDLEGVRGCNLYLYSSTEVEETCSMNGSLKGVQFPVLG
jgi:hypothetical protein